MELQRRQEQSVRAVIGENIASVLTALTVIARKMVIEYHKNPDGWSNQWSNLCCIV